jgi:hypothetical protein
LPLDSKARRLEKILPMPPCCWPLNSLSSVRFQLVDNPVKHGARRKHADLVLDDRQRGVIRQAGLREVAVGEFQITRIDQQFGKGFVFLGRRQRHHDTDRRANQSRGRDQLRRSANAANDAQRIYQRRPA